MPVIVKLTVKSTEIGLKLVYVHILSVLENLEKCIFFLTAYLKLIEILVSALFCCSWKVTLSLSIATFRTEYLPVCLTVKNRETDRKYQHLSGVDFPFPVLYLADSAKMHGHIQYTTQLAHGLIETMTVEPQRHSNLVET